MDAKLSEYDKNAFINEINKWLVELPDNAEKEIKKTLTAIGKIIKKSLEDELRRLSVEAEKRKNYDGSEPYIHMANDIKATASKDKMGNISLVVRGGQKTGYKWHIVNDGTSKTRPTNFIDRTILKAESEINNAINEMMKGLVV